MKDDNMKEQGAMGGLNLIFWPKIDGNAVFPIFQFLVKFANGIKQFTIGLSGCFGRVKSFIDSAFDGGEFAK